MGIKLPQVKQCCCGCTLESGSLIIGWLDLVGAVLMIGLAIFALVGGQTDYEEYGPYIVGAIIEICAGIISLIVSICLIVGVNKRSFKLIHFWVIITCISVILLFCNGLMDIIGGISAGYIGMALTSFIATAISMALTSYFVCVVNSLAQEILAETQPSGA